MFSIIHMDGSDEENFPIEKLEDLYEELMVSSISDGNVAVIHDATGWCISTYRDKRVVLGHLGVEGKDMHMHPVPRSKTIELWTRLAKGEIESLKSEPWLPGYY